MGRLSSSLAGSVAAVGLAVAVVLAVLAIGATPAAAHDYDYGPFSIQRYLGVLVTPEHLEIDYVVDLAEEPTRRMGDAISHDVAGFCRDTLAGLSLRVGQDSGLIDLDAWNYQTFGDGAITGRVECGGSVDVAAPTIDTPVSIDDSNFVDRLGWREIVVVADRTAVGGDVLRHSPTARLTERVEGAADPSLFDVAFTYRVDPTAPSADLDRSVPVGAASNDVLIGLIGPASLSIPGVLGALLVAAVLGAMHSLAPGHGKTVIGAYLIGTNGTRPQAFALAGAVAVSHTLGVLVLGVITLAAGAAFAPDQIYPWLQIVSGVIVVGIGIWLVANVVGERRRRAAHARSHEHGHHHHDHSHDDHHSHDHDGGWHRHGLVPHTHRFDLSAKLAEGVNWKSVGLLGLTGGLVPSTSAVIVFLIAVQLNRLALGGALILSFGVGMAVTLVAVGLGMVALADRLEANAQRAVMVERARAVFVPIVALSVLGIGTLLTTRAVLAVLA